jgi:hypothetical protein
LDLLLLPMLLFLIAIGVNNRRCGHLAPFYREHEAIESARGVLQADHLVTGRVVMFVAVVVVAVVMVVTVG